MIILSDARNNRRVNTAEGLKYITDRCCPMYWLDADDPQKWNHVGFIIGKYEKCGTEVHHDSENGKLLDFLSGVTLAKTL